MPEITEKDLFALKKKLEKFKIPKINGCYGVDLREFTRKESQFKRNKE